MEENQTNRPMRPEDRPEPKRRKRWPTVVAVFIVLAAIAGIAAYDHYIRRFELFIRDTGALQLIQKDAKAKAELGAPIQDATSLFQLAIPSGSIYTKGDGGEATVLFKVAGPKSQADVLLKARRSKGKWDLNSVDLTLPGGSRISIEVPSDAPPFVQGAGGGGVEPPKRKLPEPPAGKSDAGSKAPAAPGRDLNIEIPKL